MPPITRIKTYSRTRKAEEKIFTNNSLLSTSTKNSHLFPITGASNAIDSLLARNIEKRSTSFLEGTKKSKAKTKKSEKAGPSNQVVVPSVLINDSFDIKINSTFDNLLKGPHYRSVNFCNISSICANSNSSGDISQKSKSKSIKESNLKPTIDSKNRVQNGKITKITNKSKKIKNVVKKLPNTSGKPETVTKKLHNYLDESINYSLIIEKVRKTSRTGNNTETLLEGNSFPYARKFTPIVSTSRISSQNYFSNLNNVFQPGMRQCMQAQNAPKYNMLCSTPKNPKFLSDECSMTNISPITASNKKAAKNQIKFFSRSISFLESKNKISDNSSLPNSNLMITSSINSNENESSKNCNLRRSARLSNIQKNKQQQQQQETKIRGNPVVLLEKNLDILGINGKVTISPKKLDYSEEQFIESISNKKNCSLRVNLTKYSFSSKKKKNNTLNTANKNKQKNYSPKVDLTSYSFTSIIAKQNKNNNNNNTTTTTPLRRSLRNMKKLTEEKLEKKSETKPKKPSKKEIIKKITISTKAKKINAIKAIKPATTVNRIIQTRSQVKNQSSELKIPEKSTKRTTNKKIESSIIQNYSINNNNNIDAIARRTRSKSNVDDISTSNYINVVRKSKHISNENKTAKISEIYREEQTNTSDQIIQIKSKFISMETTSSNKETTDTNMQSSDKQTEEKVINDASNEIIVIDDDDDEDDAVNASKETKNINSTSESITIDSDSDSDISINILRLSIQCDNLKKNEPTDNWAMTKKIITVLNSTTECSPQENSNKTNETEVVTSQSISLFETSSYYTDHDYTKREYKTDIHMSNEVIESSVVENSIKSIEYITNRKNVNNTAKQSTNNKCSVPLQEWERFSQNKLNSIKIRCDENNLESSKMGSPSVSNINNNTKTEEQKTIILKPGKQWFRSLSILRQSNIHEKSLNKSRLPNKGRKWCDSVCEILEQQNKSASALNASTDIENEEIHNWKINSKIPSLNRRTTLQIVPLATTQDLSRTRNGISFLRESGNFVKNTGYVSTLADESILESFDKLSLSTNVVEREETARQLILKRCDQPCPVSFDDCYSQRTLKRCRKIGEGVYGEVFMYKSMENKCRVMKVIPIEGNLVVNGEHQKKFEEIISEIIIASELSNLRNNKEYCTNGFNELLKISCVQGKYPQHLIDLWDLYDEDHGSENDSPELFPEDQLYIILELANGGEDLEAFRFSNAEQSFAVFAQVVCSLAVAESALEFEHRDMHWGNILISQTDEPTTTFRLKGREFELATKGVKVSIIDFTLSRMTYNNCCIFNDLSLDPDLFTATGDYQFDIYRLMQQKNLNDWQHFEPYSNILWLDYTLDKMITQLRYLRVTTKTHKMYIRKLSQIRKKILEFNSATELLNSNVFSQVFL